jgi:hypothetical protein
MNATQKRRARQSVYAIAPVVALLAGFFLFRGCNKQLPAVAREALFVPRDLARLKGLDAEGVLAYCRDEIRTSNYGGV